MTHPTRHSSIHESWDWTAVRLQCLREAQRTLGRTATADDAAQEAALRVWLHRKRCRRPDRPQPWVAAIARREALRLASSGPAEPAGAAAEPQVSSPEEHLLLRLAVQEMEAARLDQSERDLLHARYWSDLTHEEIAERLGIPPATVRVRLHRIRRRLRPHALACALDR